jgi:hypothetical protein
MAGLGLSTDVAIIQRNVNIPWKCFRDEGMLFRQRVETVAHAVELLSFVQDRIGMHEKSSSPQR